MCQQRMNGFCAFLKGTRFGKVKKHRQNSDQKRMVQQNEIRVFCDFSDFGTESFVLCDFV